MISGAIAVLLAKRSALPTEPWDGYSDDASAYARKWATFSMKRKAFCENKGTTTQVSTLNDRTHATDLQVTKTDGSILNKTPGDLIESGTLDARICGDKNIPMTSKLRFEL
ncbi:hypothetical protein HPB50_002311 [Hyalomma asiaticum]|uniref:Uncharacterized protein n=1 Tax=Hyalomma asiaticum TaxID=266040 RepID=A0ACB7SJR2_HYAAI|nr:hypothetical protein HPB50_002311 [Hyalomma asiaticum]